MTIWTPDLEQHSGPRYLAIVEALAADLGRGRLAPGDRLPTHRELAGRLKVTVGTVSRAYAEAERRGLAHGQVGRGTFVGREPEPQDEFGYRTGEAIAGKLDLSCAHAAIGPQIQAFSTQLAELAGRHDLARLAGYGPGAGQPRHREAGAAWFRRRGVEARAEDIVVTDGAQHGLVCALLSYTVAGETVLVESLTYPGIRNIAARLGRRVVPVAVDADGLVPESLDEGARDCGARVLVTVPTVHNPTSSVMPLARRERIAEVCRARDLSVIEDDIYGFLVPDAPPPIATLCPERACVVTSVSKSLMPGLRCGYVHAVGGRARSIADVVATTVWTATPLTAELAANWIEDGTAERLARWQRDEARARQRIASRVLAGQEIETHPDSMYLWLHLPGGWAPDTFAAEAAAQDVLLAPSGAFSVRRTEMPNAVRVGLSTAPDRASLEAGLETLASLLERYAGHELSRIM